MYFCTNTGNLYVDCINEENVLERKLINKDSLDSKQNKNIGISNKVLISNNSGEISSSDITSTELNYLANVNNNIQTQLDAKANKSDIAVTKYVGLTSESVTYAKISDFGAWGTGAWYQKGFSMLLTSRAGETIWFSLSANDSNTSAKAFRIMNTYSKINSVYYSVAESAVYAKMSAWCNNLSAHILSNIYGDYVPTVAQATALPNDAVEVPIVEFGPAYDGLVVGDTSVALLLGGSADRPTYNSNDLALKSDIPTTYAGSSTAGGAATSAEKLATARTIGLSGDVNGSASFDGSGNVTISTTVADDSHNHIISNIDNLQSTLDNKVTLNTAQTITGIKTFNAPANVANTEQATTKFKTANGGSITFGKEGANSGTMIRLDQTDGTCRLRFRSSTAPGAMVWEQPEANAALYIDLGNSAGTGTNRISFPQNKAGTVAMTSDVNTRVAKTGDTMTGNLTAPKFISSQGLAVTQTDGTSGYGISLYGNATPQTYGLWFGKTSTYGTHGSVTSDWATYFGMNSGATTRGWVFRREDGCVASISSAGNLTLNGSAKIGNTVTLAYDATNECLNFTFV